MSKLWALISLLLFCLRFRSSQAGCTQGCPRNPSAGQHFHFIPVRLYTPESLQDSLELVRQPRQQQIVQEVVVENNFGGGFGGRPFGRPGFGGGPGFGGPGRGGFGGPGRGGFGGGFGGGFSGGFGGGFGGGFARSYGADEEQQPQPAKPSIPAAYNAPSSSIPLPPCAQSFVLSCGAVLKPVPCAAPAAKCGGY